VTGLDSVWLSDVSSF